MVRARLVVLLLAAAAFVGPALVALLAGCQGGCRGRVELEQRPMAAPDLPLVSTIAGEHCPCPAGQVCARKRCLPERAGCPTGSCDGRAVPAPGGPL